MHTHTHAYIHTCMHSGNMHAAAALSLRPLAQRPPVRRPHRGWSCCAALTASCGVAVRRRHLTWQGPGGACCRGPSSRPWLMATAAVCVWCAVWVCGVVNDRGAACSLAACQLCVVLSAGVSEVRGAAGWQSTPCMSSNESRPSAVACLYLSILDARLQVIAPRLWWCFQ